MAALIGADCRVVLRDGMNADRERVGLIII